MAQRTRWIGWGGSAAWPPRYPDLNPIDFFFWEYSETRNGCVSKLRGFKSGYRGDLAADPLHPSQWTAFVERSQYFLYSISSIWGASHSCLLNN